MYIFEENIHSVFSDKPFIKLIFPLVTGILLAIYLPNYSDLFNYSYIILLAAIIFLITDNYLFKISKKYRYRFLMSFVIHLAVFLCGIQLIYLHSSVIYANDDLLNKNNGEIIVAEIIETPVKSKKSIKTIIEVMALAKHNEWNKLKGNVITYIEKDSLADKLNIGDKIIFRPYFREIEPPKNPAEFNYKQYLSFHHIRYQLFLKTDSWLLVDKGKNNLKRYASEIRNNLLNKLKKIIPDEQSFAVASALLLGYKNAIDDEIQKAYAGSGAMHVLAVSGLHAGFIFMILNSMLFFIQNNKKTIFIKTLIVLIGLWSYALITGLSPSVMRAATMFSFITIGKTFNRHTNIYNTLAASGFILLCINPYLLMEVGFQLSYLAVIGIIYFQPKIYNLLYVKNYLPDKIWAITCVSIAAQITTFPLGLLYFHQFPNYFLFSNLLVIPLATLILVIGILLFIFSFTGILYSFLGTIISWLIFILNYSVKYIEKLPYSISERIDISITECWVIFMIILLIALYLEFKKYLYILASLLLILGLSIYNLAETIYQKNQKKIIVYHINKLTAINFIDGYDNILIADEELLNDKNKMLFHIYHNWYKSGLNNEIIIPIKNLYKNTEIYPVYGINNKNLFIKENYFQFYNCTFALIYNQKQLYDTLHYRLSVDYVIVTKNINIAIDDIIRNFECKAIIADASNTNQKINVWTNQSAERNIAFYNIRKKGAWILELK